ncbi:MAG: Na(+)/H(+) antiporter subunit B [Phycisphaera sp.]|nr:Na(+)/H(+) antiporter subunit B [Phycisphaera sp.]
MKRRMNARVVVLETVVAPLYWIILAASVWILLRGHNEPGGGFIGGLVAVGATVLWGAARGPSSARHKLPFGDPVLLAAVGVLASAVSGIPAWFVGASYLTHQSFMLPLGFTELWVSTVMLFDAGVYLCVWGAVSGFGLGLLAIDDDAGDEGADAAAPRARATTKAARRARR